MGRWGRAIKKSSARASGGLGEGLELHREAELGELGDQAFGLGFGRASVEVIGSEIAMRRAGLEHVIDGG